jgi:phage/plasmid primase-like uncharacterized protein
MNHDKEQVLPSAEGLWPEILQSLAGLPSDIFNSRKEHPCPICGGSTRFRYIPRHNLPFFCNHCGSYSGINFYMELTGVDFSTAINDVGDHLNLIPTEKREIINKKAIASNSFPSWYKFNFDRYQKINEQAEIKLSPWQRVNAVNMLDLLAYREYTLIPLLNKKGEQCDFMMIDVDGKHKTTCGNTIEPAGFYSVFGSRWGNGVYITQNPLTAAQSSQFMGVCVVCFYSLENMAEIVNKFNSYKVIAIVTDITETTEADDLQLPQLVFNSKTRQVNRKVWQPGEIQAKRS